MSSPRRAKPARISSAIAGRGGWRAWVASAILIAFFAWVAWYGTRHWQEFKVLAQVPLPHVLALFGVTLASIACNGLSIKLAVLPFGVALRWREWGSLTVLTSVANLMTPLRGGAGLRGLYLKARHGLPLAEFTSTLSAMYLLFIIVHGLMGALAMLALATAGVPLHAPLFALFLGSTATASLVIFGGFRVPVAKNRLLAAAARVINGWEQLRSHPRVLWQMLVLTAGYGGCLLVLTKVSFAAISVPLTWVEACFFTAAQNLALLVTLTPGAVGIVDGMAVYSGKAIGITTPQVIMEQALNRAVLWSTLLLLSLWAGRQFKQLMPDAVGSDASAAELAQEEAADERA